MLSIVLIVLSAIMAVLALPPVNKFVSSLLPESWAAGLQAWGRLGPRLFSFAVKRTARQLTQPKFVEDFYRYGSYLTGLRVKKVNINKTDYDEAT